MPQKEKQKSVTETKQRRHKPAKIVPVYGNAAWHKSINQTMELIRSEPPMDESGKIPNFKPLTDRRAIFENRVMRYIQYVKMFQKLDECMDMLIHPQKRALLKRCVEGVAIRVLELKHEMIATEKSLFPYFDDIMFDLGLIPEDLVIRVPNFMYQDRHRILTMRHHMLTLMLERIKTLGETSVTGLMKSDINLDGSSSQNTTASVQQQQQEEVTEEEQPSFSTQQAGRPRPICQQQPFDEHYIPSQFLVMLIERVVALKDEALKRKVLILQAHWRGWLARKRMQELREKEEINLGMSLPRYLTVMDPRETVEYEHKEQMREERAEELAISKAIEHERFMAAHGHNMAWELKYNITQWLLELRDMQGTFPDYPEEEEGGCEKLFALKTVEEVEQEIRELEEGEKFSDKKKEPENPKKVEAVDSGWRPAPTYAVPKLIDVLTEYDRYWYLKDETDNVEQRFDRQLMLEQVRDEAGKQIRLQVDELMRYELDKLRCGIELIEMPNPAAVKTKPKPEPKPKITRDPLAHKTVEELYCELVLKGIVQPVKDIKLDQFLGEQNLVDSSESHCLPTATDIKTMLTHLVLFPLSSQEIHSHVPLITRMLLAGPPGVGKTMLVHAICRETGANLFNISPPNLDGRFYGPEGQDYLMNALLKVGKSMEPTVFLVENCEEMYMRPVAGEALTGDDRPQRWAPVLYRMMDKVRMGDRMFLIGTTSQPFTCNNLPMFALYRNIVYIPLPEYGTRVLLWKEFLSRMPICQCTSLGLNPSVLAKCSEGFSPRQIEDTVNCVLSKRRLSDFRQVTNREFVYLLINDPAGPLDEEIQWQWDNWYPKTPLVRRRQEMFTKEQEDLESQAQAATPRR